MKFEKLNLGKFDKIEKNEMGKLVGGTQVWTESEAGNSTGPDPCSFSNDWISEDENGNSLQQFICSGDMAEPVTADPVR